MVLLVMIIYAKLNINERFYMNLRGLIFQIWPFDKNIKEKLHKLLLLLNNRLIFFMLSQDVTDKITFEINF